MQMLLELLDNARKNTPSGGSVGVDVTPHDGDVRIVVWDTGKGIEPEDLERIWQAFTQLETGQSVRQAGLGLGLTIVKKLAELHHGRVEVESHPGKGSRFTIDLPADTSD
jgi:signal transduction histidine kinase